MKLAEVASWGSIKEAVSASQKCDVKQQVLKVPNYSEDISKITDELDAEVYLSVQGK